MNDCVLCQEPGGQPIWQGENLRLIRADEAGFPAFYRIVWNAHVAEFSDLSAAQRQHCMEAVALVEQVLRQQLQPTKINLATLGNVVPHLHWHIIARYDWDSHFPAPVWAAAQRPSPAAQESAVRERLPVLEADLRTHLQAALVAG